MARAGPPRSSWCPAPRTSGTARPTCQASSPDRSASSARLPRTRLPRRSPDQAMPIHPAMSSRFPLLESVPSMQALIEDPAYAQVRTQFESHPDYQVPPVSVRAVEVPGPHGAVPVRVYDPGSAGDRGEPASETGGGTRPCLVWMHGGGFIAGSLDMPEADWTARELALRAGAIVVSVDYRLCNNGVHFP